MGAICSAKKDQNRDPKDKKPNVKTSVESVLAE
jgi:hypothetical protein